MTACSPTAVELDVPIYIHPHLPPEPVRQAYYSDLPPGAGRVLEAAAWGWHSETAIHVLRLVIAGTLDKYPKLKLIIGHMGEMLPVMLARIDEVFGARDRSSASGRSAAPSSTRSGSPPAASSASRRSWLRSRPSASTVSCSRSIIPIAPNSRGRDFLDASRSHRPTWPSSRTATPTGCSSSRPEPAM